MRLLNTICAQQSYSSKQDRTRTQHPLVPQQRTDGNSGVLADTRGGPGERHTQRQAYILPDMN